MVILFVVILLVIALMAPREVLGGGPDVMSWTAVDNATHDAAVGTAELLGYDVVFDRYETWTPREFEALNADNHRAVIGKTLEEIFPPEDRPRGQADIASVEFHMSARSTPAIALLEHGGKYTVLDGVHRIVAAYLTDSPIHAGVYLPREEYIMRQATSVVETVKTHESYRTLTMEQWAGLNRYQRDNSWGLISDEAIAAIKKECANDKILSIGAGNGQWEYMLRDLDIVATDINPRRSEWHSIPMGNVIECAAEAAILKYPHNVLMSVWPHPVMKLGAIVAQDMPEKIIYVGEERGYSTADDEFFDLLDKYEPVVTVNNPLYDAGWPDRMIIYKKLIP